VTKLLTKSRTKQVTFKFAFKNSNVGIITIALLGPTEKMVI